MKRIVTMVTALGLVLVGCGGDDTAATTDPTAPSADESSADDSFEESSDSAATTTEAKASVKASSGDTGASDSAAPDGDVIRTLDDIPEVCRDQMAAFLREIEPTVSAIDWENASISDFESVADDFTKETAAFEAASNTAGCNELAFEGDGEYDLLVEFAQQEVPGVADFFEFLGIMRDAATAPGAGQTGSVTMETCADGIAFIEGLLVEYDSIREVPAAQLAAFQQLPQVFISCTPEEAEFFSRPDVEAFLSE
ncbi:MAG: hypothetical protein ABIP17_05565 [Ilumatobacteraceae bacterium]